MPTSSLAAAQLRTKYADLTITGTLAGSGKLYELERYCWVCADQSQGDERAIAFALASLFNLLGRRQEGEPITYEEGQQIHSLCNQPIVACIAYVNGQDRHADPLMLIEGLADAFAGLRAVS